MLQRLLREVSALFHDHEDDPGTILREWARLRRFLRFWVVVGQGFLGNRCPSRASALAYSSLLAFVPLLAVVIGISTSVLKNDEVRIRGRIDDLLENLVPQLMRSTEFAGEKDKVVGYILEAIANIQSGTVGTTGTIALLMMILFMLARVEETLNDIWGVSQGRSWYARLVNYWAAISLGPILMFAAIGFSTSLRLDQTQAWLKGGSTRFDAEDIRDPRGILSPLESAADPVSRHLWTQLTPEATNRLAGPRGVPEDEAREVLALEFTRILQAGPLHDPERFAGVTLSERTQRLLGEQPRGVDLVRLNRFLLEDTYPEAVVRSGNGLPVVGSILLWLVPIVVLGSACSLFYALMPNTRVDWRSALVGGGVAGGLWHLNNTLSVLFVSGNSSIYKGLAAVPVFMVGLYLFWLLLLLGAQVAYTFQNRQQHAALREVNRVHQAGRERVALRIMAEATRAFLAGETPPSIGQLVDRIEVPGALVARILHTLQRTRLLVEVTGTTEAEIGYAPARPVDQITVASVLEALRRGEGNTLPTRNDEGKVVVEGALERVTEAERQAGGRSLMELVREFHANRRENRSSD